MDGWIKGYFLAPSSHTDIDIGIKYIYIYICKLPIIRSLGLTDRPSGARLPVFYKVPNKPGAINRLERGAQIFPDPLGIDGSIHSIGSAWFGSWVSQRLSSPCNDAPSSPLTTDTITAPVIIYFPDCGLYACDDLVKIRRRI